jgi:hypothetical protein
MYNLAVLFYARKNCDYTLKNVPWKLWIMPLGLFVSTPLCFGAYAITKSAFGRSPFGAKLKFGLWGIGLAVEIIAHIYMFKSNWSTEIPFCMGMRQSNDKGLAVPYSDAGIRGRLTAITTIILGEVSCPVPCKFCSLANLIRAST